MKNITRILIISAITMTLALCMPSLLPSGFGPRAVQAKRVRMNKKRIRLKTGESRQMRLINRGKKKARWYTTNPKIATVHAGRIKAVSKGKCRIYAICGAKKRRIYCRVTVKNNRFSVSDHSLELKKRESQTLIVYSGSGRAITVRSDDENVAIAEPLSGPGSRMTVRIAARYKSGTAHITIREKSSGQTRRVTVKVTGSNHFKLTNNKDAEITLKKGRQTNIWITCDSGAQIGGTIRNPENISCAWGNYHGNTIPFYVKGIEEGTSTIWFKEPETNKTIRVDITVK